MADETKQTVVPETEQVKPKQDAGKKKSSKSTKKKQAVNPELYSIIKYPVSTEKAIRLMESDNKLVFVVDAKARRPEIKSALEEMFAIKIEKVNILIDREGNKRAIVRLAPESVALDVATNLGMM